VSLPRDLDLKPVLRTGKLFGSPHSEGTLDVRLLPHRHSARAACCRVSVLVEAAIAFLLHA